MSEENGYDIAKSSHNSAAFVAESGNQKVSQGGKIDYWARLARLHRLHLLPSAASGIPYDRSLLEGTDGSRDERRNGGLKSTTSGIDDADNCRVDIRGSRVQSAAAARSMAEDDEEEDEEDSATTASNNTYIKSAIPYLPRRVAVVCLILNTFIPGTGTMLSGLSVFCCGHPRLQTKDGQYTGTVCVNFLVGIMQLFTITFLLVGWIWSIVWGIYMVLLAVEQSKRARAKHKTELKVKTLTALDSRLRAWTLRQSNRLNNE